jgi:hypothetical protein
MTFFCEFADLGNPGGETSLPGLFTGRISSGINQVLYFTVLATCVEVNIKQTIELETKVVLGEVIVRATQDDVEVTYIVNPLRERVRGPEVSVAYTGMEFIIPSIGQEFLV